MLWPDVVYYSSVTFSITLRIVYSRAGSDNIKNHKQSTGHYGWERTVRQTCFYSLLLPPSHYQSSMTWSSMDCHIVRTNKTWIARRSQFSNPKLASQIGFKISYLLITHGLLVQNGTAIQKRREVELLWYKRGSRSRGQEWVCFSFPTHSWACFSFPTHSCQDAAIMPSELALTMKELGRH